MMTSNIEKEILDYFNDNKKHSYHRAPLKVLDNKYKQFYTGVSLQYIIYNLLKAKYRKSDVCKILYTLIDDFKIKAIYCPNVKKIVFESVNTTEHSLYFQTSKMRVLEYLKQFIL